MSHHNLGRQFDNAAEQAENQQRERFSRPRGERGFVGNGYNFGGYPYMLGAMGGYGFGYGHGGYNSGLNTPGNLEPSSGQSASDNSGMGGMSAGSYGDVGGAGADSGGGGY